MTQKPTVSDTAATPAPAKPMRHLGDAGSTVADTGGDDADRSGGVDKRLVAGVAGIAVGSAAIAAALLFSGRLNRPKSASAAGTPQRPPESLPDKGVDASGSRSADAADIRID